MSDYINQADIPVTETLAEALGFDADGNWAKMVPANPADVQAAQNAAAEAKIAANNAQTTAAEAKKAAADATAAANAAGNAVQSVATLAQNANTKANSASDTANSAKTTAEQIATTKVSGRIKASETVKVATDGTASVPYADGGLNTFGIVNPNPTFTRWNSAYEGNAIGCINGNVHPIGVVVESGADLGSFIGLGRRMGVPLILEYGMYENAWTEGNIQGVVIGSDGRAMGVDFLNGEVWAGLSIAGEPFAWKKCGGSGGGLTVSDLLNNGDFLNKVAERASNEAVRKAAASQLGVDYMTAFRELDADDQDAIFSALEGTTNAETATLAAVASVKLIANMFNFSWNTGLNPLREEAADA